MAEYKFSIPIYDGQRYEQFDVEVDAWSKCTDIPINKRALALVLAMPDKKTEILEGITVANLNKEDGVATLLAYIKKNYGGDELENTLDVYEDFRSYQRTGEQTIADYCAGFEQRKKRIEAKGIKFPEEILAFEVIRNAKISNSERKLVLTGLDFSKKDEMYKNALSSLRKFIGKSFCGVRESFDSGIKVEGAYATWNRGYGNNFRGRFNNGRRNFRGTVNRGIRSRGGNSRGAENLNPLGKDGNRMKCFSCGSFRHLNYTCPYRNNNVNLTQDEVDELKNENITEAGSQNVLLCDDHIILYTGKDGDLKNELCLETLGCAILDSACSSNVAGEKWLNDFLSNHLSDNERLEVKTTRSERTFRFGDGPVIKSIMEVTIPVKIGDYSMFLKLDIVKADVPFLLSKKQMKACGMILDLANDILFFKGKKISLHETISGHYFVPLSSSHDGIKVYAVNLEHLNDDEVYKKLCKLHNQFGHPAHNKLNKLLADAGVWKDRFENMLNKIENECQICKIYKKTPDRPVVSLPIGDVFNDTVCLDLKSWYGKGWILHIIDMHTRYTRSVFIDRKISSNIIDKIMKEWVSIFGIPNKMLTDNGGEFTSDEMREVTSLLNIVKYTTGAEAPWQNGLCERIHQVTDLILLKLEASYPDVSLDVLLAWANMARNSLQMYLGFSSHQLVFGINPNLPNVLTDKLPAMNETTGSEVFAKHLNVLRESREAFIRTDANMRIKRALRHKLRCVQKVYNRGDWVYYKRDNSERWLGPAKVMFQDSKVVFVRHGSIFYRVSINRVNSASDKDMCLNSEKEVLVENPCSVCSENVTDNDKALCCDKCSLWCHIDCARVDEGVYDRLVRTGESFQWECQKHIKNRTRLPIKNSIQEVFVNYVPKSRLNDEKCLLAKQEELNKLKEYDVYIEVDQGNNDCVSTRWIMTYKGKKVKARLVARGFEEEALLQVDSPTISKSGMNILFMITGMYKWIIRTTDIRSAFLQGRVLERDVFIKPPEEAGVKDGRIWKLRKCLYGLADASRQFYISVREVLLKSGCKHSIYDASFFFFKSDRGLEGIIVSHIDDFLHAGTDIFQDKIIKSLVENFTAGKEEEKTFSYVGLQIRQEFNGIYVDQLQYIDNLEIKKTDKEECKNKDRCLNPSEMTEYRSAVGCLNWCVRGSRPDLGFALVNCSTKFKNATVSDLCKVKKALRKLKSERTVIFYPNMNGNGELEILVFSDAAFHNLNDKMSSTLGYVILCRKDDRCCVLDWQTNKIKRIVHSSLAAETLALKEALGNAISLRDFIKEVTDNNCKIHAYVDNKGLATSCYSTTQIDDPRLVVDINCLRQEVSEGKIESISWLPGTKMIADCLTKEKASCSDLLSIIQKGELNVELNNRGIDF